MREELVSAAENLALYAHVGSGTGGLPMEAFAEAGVAVTHASGLMPQVAEQVVGYLLFFARRFDEAWARNREHEWRRFQPDSLRGSTVTVVGLGSIGRQLVDRLRGFDVRTVGVRYTPGKGGPTDEVIGYDENALHEVLSRTDYLVLACPLSDTTRGLIGRAELSTLPTTAVLVNVARGPVVDTDALTAAVRNNTLAGAGLDVTDPEPLPSDHPLWEFDNVFITPHTAGNVPEHWANVADLLARNLERAAETGSYEDLTNQVR
jgi:phosphoglycerate dehydrogenase-like enzyme